MIVYMYYGLLPEIKLSYLILSYLIRCVNKVVNVNREQQGTQNRALWYTDVSAYYIWAYIIVLANLWPITEIISYKFYSEFT